MTSTETADASARPSFRGHVPTLIASAGGTVAAATLSSFLGAFGTWAGLVGGSVISGTVAWYAEQLVRRAHRMAAAKARIARARGRRLTRNEERQVEDIYRQRRPIHWRLVGGLAAASLALGIGAVTSIEAMAGDRPLANLVQGHPGHGWTLTGGTGGAPQPSERPTVTPSVSGTTPSGTSSSTSTALPTPVVTPSGSTATSPAPTVSGLPTGVVTATPPASPDGPNPPFSRPTP